MSGTVPKGKAKAPCTIDIVVVGGGVAGLACALGLGRAGHRVVVLEEDDQTGDGGCGSRLPPNMTRILRDRWELGEEMEKTAVTIETGCVSKYETGEVLGLHPWNDAVMQQTGASFEVMHHADLIKMLQDAAKSFGAQIRTKCKVVSITSGSFQAHEKPTVSLASGETLTADFIIGADGPDSSVKSLVLGKADNPEPMGLLSWHTLIPWSAVEEDPDLEAFAQGKDVLWQHYGGGHAAVGYPLKGHGKQHFCLHAWTPDDGSFKDPGRGSWREAFPNSMMVNALGECDPRIKKLAKLGKLPSCLRVFKTSELQDFIPPDSPVILVGDAAHSFPAGSIQQNSMVIGDAACLSEFFSHLASLDQMPTLLEAFEEVRQPRVNAILKSESFIMHYITASGSSRDARDTQMRKQREEGRGVFEDTEMFAGLLNAFNYDAVDGAAEWWMTWGTLNERTATERVDVVVSVS
ncbi:FAD/NAD(P)-binding domain-containing protein [Neolentinus lepideus HHB14362 ss-1]|uniref:FAD/NAD(P)-binding domain-containing protein n=1 Tax=Neolentinus lepideus HHB14362 ss-1 TaxID=1314782 RepID=A0A165VF31_9AGAM|nr:FAD/NAD(P)-binding domain-containing protein [Neolentinus lepideus HHB14362 ss-1]